MDRDTAIDYAREYLRSKRLRAWKYSHFYLSLSGYYGIVAHIAYYPGRTMDLQISPTGKVRHA